MPRKPTVPAYRHQKARNLAVVRIAGRDFYLGTYDCPESHQRYDQLIAAWLSHGRRLPDDIDLFVPEPNPGSEGEPTPVFPVSVTVHRFGLPSRPESQTTVAQLAKAYVAHANTYYRKRGTRTREAPS